MDYLSLRIVCPNYCTHTHTHALMGIQIFCLNYHHRLSWAYSLTNLWSNWSSTPSQLAARIPNWLPVHPSLHGGHLLQFGVQCVREKPAVADGPVSRAGTGWRDGDSWEIPALEAKKWDKRWRKLWDVPARHVWLPEGIEKNLRFFKLWIDGPQKTNKLS